MCVPKGKSKGNDVRLKGTGGATYGRRASEPYMGAFVLRVENPLVPYKQDVNDLCIPYGGGNARVCVRV